MILIFTDRNDYSTVKVMEFLFYLDEPVIRVNREDTVNAQFHIDVSHQNHFEIEFLINEQCVSLSQSKVSGFEEEDFILKK